MEDFLTNQDTTGAPPTLGAPSPSDGAFTQVSPSAPSPMQATPTPAPAAPPARSGSRLSAILSAVAKVGETALAGIPDRGRPSFVTGLGQGARAEQAAQATQQAVKFRDLDSQIRLAELHNQDVKMQNDTQAQKDAHTEAELHMRSLANDLGVDYDTIANHGPAVMDHLAAQTAATGAASVPAGTHISADGSNIYVPKDSDSEKTQAGQKQLYGTLAPALGLPSLPASAQFVPPKLMNMLTNKVNGFGLNGDPIKHEELPGVLGAAQAQRDNLAKNGGTPAQLKTLDNMIGIYKANLDALDTHAAGVKQQTEQATINAQNSPESIAGAAAKAKAISDAELPNKLKVAQATSDIKANAAAAQATASGWLPKVGADEKKKAELAENIAFNANEVAKIVMKRPDILGAIAGRYTNAQQMIGNNDPDISALGVHVHNMAMANSGVHGFRSQEGVESYERQLLNNFKNGPAAMAGALRASTGSVQTFIDNARPESYKTHSKQGGAVRGMMETQ